MKGILKGLVAAVIGLGLTVSSANAAECKGQSESACSSSSSCSWVGGFKRKDGVSVTAYCRNAKSKSKLDKVTSSKKDAMKSKVTDKAKSKKMTKKEKAKAKKEALKAKAEAAKKS